MKAIVCTKYGSPEVLQLQEMDKPKPKDNEILIKVFTTAATTADSMMRRADPFISRFILGFSKPKIPVIGTGFAGKIVATGKNVRTFLEGDEVFGETGVNFSANAEYVCIPEDGVISLKPENLSFEELASFCDGPLTSLNFLREVVKIQPGQKVLINGASGSLGTAAVQLAKNFGAQVTGVCSSSNIELVKSLGADFTIDYTKQDFTKTGQTYDIIFDTVGKSSFSASKQVLAKNGVYLSPVLSLPLLFQMIRTSLFGSKKAKFSATGLQPAPKLRKLLKELKEIAEKGALKMVIAKRYPLEKTIEAHRLVDSGHKVGNVILTVA